MWYLTLLASVGGYFAFSLVLKIGASKSRHNQSVLIGVFAGLSALSVFVRFVDGGQLTGVTDATLLWGVIGGVAMLLTSMFYVNALTVGNYGTTVSIIYCSFVIPVGIAVLSGQDQLKPATLTGIVMVILSLFLLTYVRKTNGVVLGETNKPIWIRLVLAAFACNAVAQITQVFCGRQAEPDIPGFILISSGAALLLMALYLVAKRERFIWSGSVIGLLGGVFSFAGNYFAMKALAILPTALVFPATLVGPMLLAAITSVLIFREKIKAEGFAGLAIAAVGLVLLSMNAK